jgi:hypothetical protein
MYASFLDLPVEGRHLRALHLELFTMPSSLTTFYELIKLIDEKLQVSSV